MTGSIVRHLILKDLYLLRWFSVGAIAAGVVSVGVMATSPLAIGGGGVLLICTLIVLNIFLVMQGVVQERKDKVALFVMSLPVSPAQYVTAKVAANMIAFVVPWSIAAIAVTAVIGVSQVPAGWLPLWMALFGYLFFYYCVLLGVGVNTTSNGWHATTITIGNISVNFFVMLLFGLPSLRAYGDGPTAVWSGDIVGIIVAEMVAGVLVLAVAIAVHARRTEFV